MQFAEPGGLHAAHRSTQRARAASARTRDREGYSTPLPKAFPIGFILTEHLNQFTPEGKKKKFTTKTTLTEVCRLRCKLNLLKLLHDIYKQIESNLPTEDHKVHNSVSDENWRWELKPNIAPHNPNRETRLEKELASRLLEARWANQVPTASGLITPHSDKKRNIDLAHWDGAAVTLIELKAPKPDAKTMQTPLLAAFEIVRNALLLCLARAHQEPAVRIRIARRDVWKDAKKADLRVIAPARFYRGLALNWFEQELKRAVSAFGNTHALEMSFAFGCFGGDGDKDPTDEPQLLAALERKVEWH